MLACEVLGIDTCSHASDLVISRVEEQSFLSTLRVLVHQRMHIILLVIFIARAKPHIIVLRVVQCPQHIRYRREMSTPAYTSFDHVHAHDCMRFYVVFAVDVPAFLPDEGKTFFLVIRDTIDFLGRGLRVLPV